jgi:type IX secretion system PorP/SprF family membrane protein
MRRSFKTIAGTIFLTTTCWAQDPFFSNTLQSLVYLNPSFAGSNGGLRNQTHYRNEWPDLAGPTFVAIGNSFDAFIKPAKAGLALSVLSDDQDNGRFTTGSYHLTYAQHFSWPEKNFKIVPSIQVGYMQHNLDLNKLHFGSRSTNARYGETKSFVSNGSKVTAISKDNYGLSAALLLHYKSWIMGASFFNINEPDMGMHSVHKIPLRTCFNLAYNLPLGERALLNLSGVSQYQAANSRQQFNSLWQYRIFMAGVGYSYSAYSIYGERAYNSTLLLQAGLHFSRINLSYLAGLNLLSSKPRGQVHELSISFTVRSKRDSIPPRIIENW